MFDRYVLLDLQCPNTRGSSVCAIAVILVEKDRIVRRKYSLINPGESFDVNNPVITGIENGQVQEAPTLEEYWGGIESLLRKNIIVGHNISYKLVVLSQALKRYGIELGNCRYLDTVELSSKYIRAESLKLECLMEVIGYKANKNTGTAALKNALMAGEVLKYINAQRTLSEDEVYMYSFSDDITEKQGECMAAGLHRLAGIIQGSFSEGAINEAETICLKKWVEDNRIYKKYRLFSKIIDTLTAILKDNTVAEYDKLKLKFMATKYSSSPLFCKTALGIQILQGVVEGITCDSIIDKQEIEMLNGWLLRYDYLTGVYPYDKLVYIVQKLIGEQVISESDNNALKEVFLEMADPAGAHSHLPNQFILNNKSFCLTGEFTCASKKVITQRLKEKGAIEKSRVSFNLDYLFAGGTGSEAWKYGNADERIMRALELQANGSKVRIIAEEELEMIIS